MKKFNFFAALVGAMSLVLIAQLGACTTMGLTVVGKEGLLGWQSAVELIRRGDVTVTSIPTVTTILSVCSSFTITPAILSTPVYSTTPEVTPTGSSETTEVISTLTTSATGPAASTSMAPTPPSTTDNGPTPTPTPNIVESSASSSTVSTSSTASTSSTEHSTTLSIPPTSTIPAVTPTSSSSQALRTANIPSGIESLTYYFKAASTFVYDHVFWIIGVVFVVTGVRSYYNSCKASGIPVVAPRNVCTYHWDSELVWFPE